MITFIRTAKLRELHQQLDGLRSVNNKNLTTLNEFEERFNHILKENGELRKMNESQFRKIELIENEKWKLEKYQSQSAEEIAGFRAEIHDFKGQNRQLVKHIELLEADLKITRNKANTLAEQSLKDKETIQNLRNEITLLKEEIAGKDNAISELKEKVEILREKKVPTMAIVEVPNTMEAVELGAVAPLEAEVVPTPKPVNNVKRRYQKSGKFKRK